MALSENFPEDNFRSSFNGSRFDEPCGDELNSDELVYFDKESILPEERSLYQFKSPGELQLEGSIIREPSKEEIILSRAARAGKAILAGLLSFSTKGRLDPTSLVAPQPAITPEEASARKEIERGAHHFRVNRLKKGAVHEFMYSLQHEFPDDPDVRIPIKRMVSRKKTLLQGTQEEGELHRTLTPFLSGVLVHPETRKGFMEALNTEAANQSEELKQEAREGKLRADVVVVGGGVHAAIFAAEYRANSPDARILIVDNGKKLGGQFSKYGSRPVFGTNSRDIRRQDNDKVPLASGAGNLNSFGPKAPLQLPDFTSQAYVNNLDMGTCAAVNQYLSAETMLSAEVFASDYNQSCDDSVELRIRDTNTNESFFVEGTTVVIASGIGERSDGEGNVWSADQFLAHFGNEENEFPMDAFTDKDIAIIGIGDTGKVSSRLLTWQGPEGAYGNSVVQLGGAKKITWYGATFRTKEEFCRQVRPLYHDLAPSIATGEPSDNEKLTIFPKTERVARSATTNEKALLLLRNEDGSLSTVEHDIAIDATTAPDRLEAIFGRSADRAPYVVSRSGKTLARYLNDRTIIVGPAAKLPLDTDQQKALGPNGENTVSIWANERANVATARALSTKKILYPFIKGL